MASHWGDFFSSVLQSGSSLRQTQDKTIWLRPLAALSITLFTLLSCSPSIENKELQSCYIIIPNNLQFINISYAYINKIAYEKDNPLQYVVEIENRSNHSLDNLRLMINYKWIASLKDLLYYQGFLKGYQPYGESSFPPNKKLRFTFSKKSSNRRVFIDVRGKPMPDLTFIHSLRLISDQGAGTWGFSDP